MANTTACRPKTTAAACGLNEEMIRMISRTAVVTHAENRGPRTSTPSTWAGVLLLDTNYS
jgi:hypothetical protein